MDVAPDFGTARVFWSVVETVGSASREETSQALERAAGFVRHCLAQRLPLRRMPSLHFHYDPSLALGSETLALLRELRPEDEK